MLAFFFCSFSAPHIILKVMTSNPECATFDTTILDALHGMHDGKYLDLPVLDRGEHWFFSPRSEAEDSKFLL